MSYLVLAYPQLKEKDFERIQSYRREHDRLYYSVVEPHFTFVFPVFDFSEVQFVDEVYDILTTASKIDFTIRCATINKDAFTEYFHAQLVPDEGYSKIVKLHDRLYGGKLINNLRLDIDFIPHMGVGNSKDKLICKKMVDEWNASEFEISGTISYLTIVNYENGKVTELRKIELK